MGIPEPDVNLEVGSGSHAWQTAEILRKIEPVLIERKPDCVLVVGDVNSTVAASLAAAKLGIPVVHVEAGLRSFDRTMPEEINRIVTDALSDYLFVTEEDAIENLIREGKHRERIYLVGNVMIDALKQFLPSRAKIQNRRRARPGRRQRRATATVRTADAASPVKRRLRRNASALLASHRRNRQ